MQGPSLSVLRLHGGTLCALATWLACAQAHAQAPAENAARGLQREAIEEDSLNTDYDGAAQKLSAALTQCGEDSCPTALRATLTRDLGAMLILGGRVTEGQAAFAGAFRLDPSLDLDAAYRTPALEKIWMESRETSPTRDPHAATAATDCPPDFPGCGESKTTAVCETDDDCPGDKCIDGRCADQSTAARRAHKIWVGVAVSMDFVFLPGAQNVCVHTPDGTRTLNSAGYQCVDPSTGANFPGTNGALNGQIVQGSAAISGDGVAGGVTPGDLRLMMSFDYAVTNNWLLGARAGYSLFTDPASAPGRAFLPIHLEARGTYLFGENAIASRFAPMLLFAVGLGEFDSSIGVTVQLQSGAHQNETAWLTSGPAFLAAGGGARLLLSPNVAATAAAKVQASFGGGARFLLGVAPELGVELGL